MGEKRLNDFWKSLIVLIIIGLLGVLAWRSGIFASVEAFEGAIDSTGVFAPIIFVIYQTLANLVLFIPCQLGYPVGVACFGPLIGFVLNYISSFIGGLAIYGITHKYGVAIVKKNVSKKVYDKYEKLRSNTKACEIILFVALLLPIFPDNAISYVVSLSDMKFKRYAVIYLLCKPWQLIIYSWGWGAILNWLSNTL